MKRLGESLEVFDIFSYMVFIKQFNFVKRIINRNPWRIPCDLVKICAKVM